MIKQKNSEIPKAEESSQNKFLVKNTLNAIYEQLNAPTTKPNQTTHAHFINDNNNNNRIEMVPEEKYNLAKQKIKDLSKKELHFNIENNNNNQDNRLGLPTIKVDNPIFPFYIGKLTIEKIILLYLERQGEEIEYIKDLGGLDYLCNALLTHKKNGISESIDDKNNREKAFDTNIQEEVVSDSMVHYLVEGFSVGLIQFLIILGVAQLIIGLLFGKNSKTDWMEGVGILITVGIMIIASAVITYNKDQEFNIMKKLNKASEKILVIRNGIEKIISEEQLLVGDLVKITTGQTVSFDGILISGWLTVNECIISGHNDLLDKNVMEICKQDKDTLYTSFVKSTIIETEKRQHSRISHSKLKKTIMNNSNHIDDSNLDNIDDVSFYHRTRIPSPIVPCGSFVYLGTAMLIVLAVGQNSFKGKMQEEKETVLSRSKGTKLQSHLYSISNFISKVGLLAALVIGVILMINLVIRVGNEEILFKLDKNIKDIMDIIVLCICLLVVAVPEGLPFTVTMAISFAARKMLKEKIIVRNIEACEALACIDYLIIDKNGLLTSEDLKIVVVHDLYDSINTQAVYAKSNNQLIRELNNSFINKVVLNDKDKESNQTKSVNPRNYFNENFYNLMKISIACNTSVEFTSDNREIASSQIDLSLVVFLKMFEDNISSIRNLYIHYYDTDLKRLEYTKERKIMSTIIYSETFPTKYRIVVKGKATVMLDLCSRFYDNEFNRVIPLDDKYYDMMLNAVSYYESARLKPLCFAYKDLTLEEAIHWKSFEKKKSFNIYSRNKSSINASSSPNINNKEKSKFSNNDINVYSNNVAESNSNTRLKSSVNNIHGIVGNNDINKISSLNNVSHINKIGTINNISNINNITNNSKNDYNNQSSMFSSYQEGRNMSNNNNNNNKIEHHLKDTIFDNEKDLTLIGFVGLKDVIKQDIKPALKDLIDSKTKILIFTDDSQEQSAALAKSVDLISPTENAFNNYSNKVITGEDLYTRVGGILCSNCDLNNDNYQKFKNLLHLKTRKNEFKKYIKEDKKKTIGNNTEFGINNINSQCTCFRSKEEALLKIKNKLKQETSVSFIKKSRSLKKIDSRSKSIRNLDKEHLEDYESFINDKAEIVFNNTRPFIRKEVIPNIDRFKFFINNAKMVSEGKSEHKKLLITGLQQLNYTVGVTGFTTKDSISLSKSDLAISVHSLSNNVVREFSDMVILDDNISTILNGIQWGRNIYSNVKRFLTFQLSVNVTACMFILICVASTSNSPLSPVQLLWINLIMDSLSSIALANNTPSKDNLNQEPFKQETIIDKVTLKFIIGQAVSQILILLIIFFTGTNFISETNSEIMEFSYCLQEVMNVDFISYSEDIQSSDIFDFQTNNKEYSYTSEDDKSLVQQYFEYKKNMRILPGQNHHYLNSTNVTYTPQGLNISHIVSIFNTSLAMDLIENNDSTKLSNYAHLSKDNNVFDFFSYINNTNSSIVVNITKGDNLDLNQLYLDTRISTIDEYDTTIHAFLNYVVNTYNISVSDYNNIFDYSAYVVNSKERLSLANLNNRITNYNFYYSLNYATQKYGLSDLLQRIIMTDHCVNKVFKNEALNLENLYTFYYSEYGGFTHFTIIFNCFIFMQLFTQLCSNDLKDRFSCGCITDSFSNSTFTLIWIIEIVIQIMIIQLTGQFFKVVTKGLTMINWAISIGFAFLTFFVNFMLKSKFLNRLFICKFKKKVEKLYSDNSSSFHFAPRKKMLDKKNSLVVRTFSRAHSLKI